MADKNYMLLACPTLRREITVIMSEEGLTYPVFYLPDELHLVPEKLRDYLCDFIPRLVNVDYLLMPMGRCGNGTMGIPSAGTTLVLPRCEDCIDLLLSKGGLADTERPKYHYFFTDSWLDYKHSFTNEYEHTKEKYGPDMGNKLMQTMYKHYQCFSYVDSGYGDYESSAERVKPLAEAVDVQIGRLCAPFGALRKMLRLDFDEDFILVPPNSEVTFEMFS